MARLWHMIRDGERLTLARHLPARFDVAAETVLPDARRGRLAHQIRQDVWRALRQLRGFSPVVVVDRRAGRLHVAAGGRLDGRAPPGTTARIAHVLEDGANRRRWIACAGRP